jgi:hypothetical protein
VKIFGVILDSLRTIWCSTTICEDRLANRRNAFPSAISVRGTVFVGRFVFCLESTSCAGDSAEFNGDRASSILGVAAPLPQEATLPSHSALATCVGRFRVAERVRMFCTNVGIYQCAAVLASFQVRGADLEGACNRKDITEYRTHGKLVALPTITVSGENGIESLGAGLGYGGGIAHTECRVAPWQQCTTP